MARRTSSGILGARGRREQGVFSLSSHAEARRDGMIGEAPTNRTLPKEWGRPADWLALPAVTATEKRIVGVAAVENDLSNQITISATYPTTTLNTSASTSNASATDASSYVTSVATYTANSLILFMITNTHATAASAVSTITGAAGAPTFTERATIEYSPGFRVSLWTAVPTANYTGSFTVDFGGVTQSGFGHSIHTVSNIDTSTNHGLLQVLTNTGTGTAPTTSVTTGPGFLVAFTGTTGTPIHSYSGSGWARISTNNNASAPTYSWSVGLGPVGSSTPTASLTASSAWGQIVFELTRNRFVVDWGDGTTETLATGVVGVHNYDFSAVSSGTTTSRGHRQVLIDAAVVGTNLTGLDLRQRPDTRGTSTIASQSRWTDVLISAPNATSIAIGGGSSANKSFPYLERVSIISSALTSYAGLFGSMAALKTASVTSSATVTSAASMFNGSTALEIGPWVETPAVTNFSSMFSGCSALYGVPAYNTKAGTNFAGMFTGASSLKHVPFMDTSNGTAFSSMFSGCSALEFLPWLDTSKATTFYQMFKDCFSLRAIPDYRTPLVTTFYEAMRGCYSLLAGPDFDLNSALTTENMFYDCRSMETVPFYNTATVNNMTRMFYLCYSLRAAHAFSTAANPGTSYMFGECMSLTSLPQMNLAALSDTTNIFFGCLSAKGDAIFDLSATTSLTGTFRNCRNLTRVAITTSSALTSFSSPFYDCASLRSIEISNMTNVTGSTTSTFGLYGLGRAVLSGLRVGISLTATTRMLDAAFEETFESLGTVSGAQTFAIASANTPVSLSGTTTSGSTTVTMASTTGLSTGMEISGIGISDAVAVTFQDTGDTITRTAHGLADGTRISFATVVTTTGIAAYTPYYVVNATANTFQVSDTLGGSAKALTTNGSGTLLYGTTITAINPNVSVTLSVPASASGTVTTSSAVLKRSIARLKGWTVSG